MIVSKPGGISKGNFSMLCKQTDPDDFMVASSALLIEGKSGIANTELETQELKIFFCWMLKQAKYCIVLSPATIYSE